MNRPMRRWLLVPSVLLAASLAAGCGGSDTQNQAGQSGEADSPPALDACTLFTYEDAQAIAGETLAAMSSTLDEAVGRDPGQCIYNSGTLDQPRIISLQIRQHRSPEAAKRLVESSRSTFGTMSGGNVQDVPGLGEGAIWVGGRIQQLHIIRGDRQLIITVQSPDGTDQLPQARQIAEKVLGRLNAA